MLRFSIRDVLWLTMVVGLGVGWSMSWRANRALAEQFDRLRYEVLCPSGMTIVFTKGRDFHLESRRPPPPLNTN
jgi:hypothetical protein